MVYCELSEVESSDVRWEIFPYGKFSRKCSAIFFQKIFLFLKSSLNISFFNLFLVALGLNEIAVTVDLQNIETKKSYGAAM
jgi:hypothetical protein